ncbi:chemotaxis protein CheA [Salmonella enterica subsp. enterica serovar Heidelberg str. N189]|nr:chemotaxis protein CheA [Salmonella enterica subsp. enterica serovar Heidelberg str. N189]
MDISDFYQTFFDEADELLADMEQHLLDLVPESPDAEQLNAIFRAAHSIKGGAGTFGFTILQETTHLMENLLDEARRGEMQLNTDIINLFLETKDIMQEQLDAYKKLRRAGCRKLRIYLQCATPVGAGGERRNHAGGRRNRGTKRGDPGRERSRNRIAS